MQLAIVESLALNGLAIASTISLLDLLRPSSDSLSAFSSNFFKKRFDAILKALKLSHSWSDDPSEDVAEAKRSTIFKDRKIQEKDLTPPLAIAVLEGLIASFQLKTKSNSDIRGNFRRATFPRRSF